MPTASDIRVPMYSSYSATLGLETELLGLALPSPQPYSRFRDPQLAMKPRSSPIPPTLFLLSLSVSSTLSAVEEFSIIFCFAQSGYDFSIMGDQY